MANLNLKSQSQNTFDAIVVGSGISGGWAAKELTEKGLKVLLLERGGNLVHPNYATATKNPWEFEHRGRLTTEDKENHFVQARHYSFNGACKHYYINDKENPYEETKRYDWVRANVVGGRSLLWARMCYRWGNIDFEANLKDGHGIDWPIRYKDLEPWYNYVEPLVGISGQRENLEHFPDMNFQPPMEMNCAELDFKRKVEQIYPERRVTIGRTANLTVPVKGRGVCQYRNQCDRGCPYGAYFSTNASTLPAAFATGNLTLKTNALVNRVIYDEGKQRAKGVEVIDTETNEVTEYYASILFLNAATLATTFILLNSTSSRFPNGLGNGSDQVGRNIMDHHKGAGASAQIEGFDDQYYSGRRPTGIYIPRFRNLKTENQKYLRGFGLQGGASRGGWWNALSMEAIGEALKKSVQQPGNWSISIGGFGECLPYPENRITLNTSIKDKYGRNTLSMNVEFKDNERAMHDDIGNSAAEILEACGYKDIKKNTGISVPGNANHEMGSARMGRDPKTSVLNAFNQMHEVKNVFITDGSCMVSTACVNPSLTYMALTARACDYAVKEMKKGNL